MFFSCWFRCPKTDSSPIVTDFFALADSGSITLPTPGGPSPPATISISISEPSIQIVQVGTVVRFKCSGRSLKSRVSDGSKIIAIGTIEILVFIGAGQVGLAEGGRRSSPVTVQGRRTGHPGHHRRQDVRLWHLPLRRH